MFINHTEEYAFEVFESRFRNILIDRYSHIKEIPIHCFTINQYRQLNDIEPITWDNDTFAYSVSRTPDYPYVFASIIYSPDQCRSLELSIDEMISAIGHEFGHIIHYFNEALDCKNSRMIEIKADEVSVELGLGEYLINVLNKLISIREDTDHQNLELSFRRDFIKLLINAK